jgi:hypothetical protein
MLRIQDETSLRKDLAVRRETKFVLTGTDLGQIRSSLLRLSTRQVHNETISVVRSVYFDDYRLSACHANLDGLGERTKLRLRWYDSILPERSCFLEIKWRSNRVTGKYRMRVDSTMPVSDLSYRELRDEVLRTAPPAAVAAILQYPEPVVVVEYKREHYLGDHGDFRATIDYDLAFYDQTGKRAISMSFPIRNREFVVVEGKTPLGREYALRQILYPIRLRASRCSKYVKGCQALGLVDGAH